MAIDPHTHDLDPIRLEIARIAPEFEGKHLVRLGEGMDSFAVLAGDAFVFRFSKHAEAAVGLRREIALLPRLAQTLNLDIPRFEYVGEHSVTGLPFVGYGLIRDEPLHRPLYESLTEAMQDGVLADLAAFLTAVHVFSVAEATDCGLALEGGREAYVEDLQRAQEDVFPLLPEKVRFDVESRLEGFLEDDQNFEYTPRLLHGDMWPEHVLYSPAVGRLAGVIDFGDVSIGDPDYDLAFLAERLGYRFVEGLLCRYEHADAARLSEKLRCFVLFNTIADIFIGCDRGDRDLVDSALAELKEQQAAVL